MHAYIQSATLTWRSANMPAEAQFGCLGSHAIHSGVSMMYHVAKANFRGVLPLYGYPKKLKNSASTI